MIITKKEKEIVIKKTLKKGETYRISEGKKFTSISFFKKPQLVKGVASYCEDGKHVLFIDYDDVPLWLVRQDYERLQEEFGIPKGYLFTTKEGEFGNFHVICLAKFFPKQIYDMISITHADVNFMSMPLRNKYRNWILRIGVKRRKNRPKFVSFIGKKIFKGNVSNAHLKLLEKLYPSIKHPSWKTDELNKISLQEYQAT